MSEAIHRSVTKRRTSHQNTEHELEVKQQNANVPYNSLLVILFSFKSLRRHGMTQPSA
jgi:hypothetical protein